MCYCSPLALYLSFLCFGLLAWIQSRPYVLCHHPYTLAHIKGFGSPLFACLCLFASMFYACVSLSCSRLCHASCSLRVYGYVATSNAYEALFERNHLGCIAMMPVTSCIPFPFSTPCNDVLAMLVCATCWLYVHLYMLTYMSMHESCLQLCHQCFNTMKLWTFDLNLHLSLMDTTFCLFSCLFMHPFCLFVWYLACLPARMFGHILVAMFAMSIMFIYFMPLSYVLCTFSFHCLYVDFVSLPLHVRTWSEDAWSYTVSQVQAKRARMLACGYEPSSGHNQ